MPMPRDGYSAPHSDAERQIVDDPDELFDLVDESDRVVGQVRRGEAHRNPAFIHRSVQILVFASDGRLYSSAVPPGRICSQAITALRRLVMSPVATTI